MAQHGDSAIKRLAGDRSVPESGPAATLRDTAAAAHPVGSHLLLDLYGCPADRLDDVALIEAALRDAVAAGHAELLHLATHHFEPQGVTAMALLAESHLSIHTWPEHGYAAVDLFTCGTATDPHAACALLIARLAPQSHALTTTPRG
jgi:S-adenosylmethionine decarboxylase